jgi:hypothetical protein
VIAGGSLHDRLILACARSGGESALLTVNPRHFQRRDPGPVEILVPSA